MLLGVWNEEKEWKDGEKKCICMIQFHVQCMLRSTTGWEKKENQFLRQSVINVRNLLQLNFLYSQDK